MEGYLGKTQGRNIYGDGPTIEQTHIELRKVKKFLNSKFHAILQCVITCSVDAQNFIDFTGPLPRYKARETEREKGRAEMERQTERMSEGKGKEKEMTCWWKAEFWDKTFFISGLLE